MRMAAPKPGIRSLIACTSAAVKPPGRSVARVTEAPVRSGCSVPSNEKGRMKQR
jgi:hypothetical protein